MPFKEFTVERAKGIEPSYAAWEAERISSVSIA